MSRREIFDLVKAKRGGRGFSMDDVTTLDMALDRLGVPKDGAPVPDVSTAPGGLRVNAKGLKLMREFEGCKLDAYPDPGSRDGNPWTIGYGSTGPGIQKGVKWTQAQCEERHEQDVAKFAAGVAKLLSGAATNSDQFSALVSIAYNIGLGALGASTLLRLHKAGDYVGAAAQFGRWNKNDGVVMKGLTRRRAAEAAMYRGQG